MPSEVGELIPLCEPSMGAREREYVDECVRSGWVSSVGSFVNRFESEFAARLGVSGAVAVSSGTAALHLALLAAGVRLDEEVLVSSMTFIAPANAVRYAGAWPVFVDAEPEHWQMDVRLLAEFLDSECESRADGVFNRATGRRVSAILPVHILGHPVDMDAVMEIAGRYELKVVEDATESLGAKVRGRPAGTIGHAGCFSFNGNKLITTGGGGMVVSAYKEICRGVRYLSTQAKELGNEYIHKTVGFNYRLTNVQAALGCAQLERVDEFLERKRSIARSYFEALARVPGVLCQREAGWAESAWWLFTILVDPARFGRSARELIDALARDGVSSRPLWQPLHLSSAHACSPPASCPVASRLFEQGVSLPSSVGLTEASQRRVCESILSAAKPAETKTSSL